MIVERYARSLRSSFGIDKGVRKINKLLKQMSLVYVFVLTGQAIANLLSDDNQHMQQGSRFRSEIAMRQGFAYLAIFHEVNE